MPYQVPNPILSLRTAEHDTAELLIYGDIGFFSNERASVMADSVVNQLNGLAPEVRELTVRINSRGGAVTDGLAIYQALRRCRARKVVTIDGIAGSIASVIAMAGDVVQMQETSLLMIHAPFSGRSQGNAHQLRSDIDELDAWANTMAAAYAGKTGRPVAEMLELLSDGCDHWFTAEEAVAEGFADEIVSFDTTTDFPAAAYLRAHLPEMARRAPPRIAAAVQQLTQGTSIMPTPASSSAAHVDITAAQRAEILAVERDRCAYMRDFGGRSPAIAALAEQCIAEGASKEAFGARALAILAQGAEPLGGYMGGSVSDSRGTSSDFIAAAADALAIRAGIPLERPHAGHRDFMTMDAGDLARACLTRSGRSVREFDRVGVIRAAMSTSDFPALLGNALGKSLRQGYESEPQSHAAWTRRVLVDDFKPQLRVLLSSAPDLLHVPEGGEYKDGAVDDDAMSYGVAKNGRIIQLTWESLINDDLGAFVRLPQAMGQAARRKEADLVYALFEPNSYNGPTMQDGVPLFDPQHANLAAPAAGLTAEALSVARTMLRRQTAKGGGLLNVQPRFLIVPAELETAAEALLAISARAVSTGSENTLLPGWIGQLQLVVEPRLAGDGFYLAASPAQVDTLEVAGLQADAGVPVVEEDGEFRRDVQSWKVRHTIGAAFTDWRGIVKVPVSG